MAEANPKGSLNHEVHDEHEGKEEGMELRWGAGEARERALTDERVAQAAVCGEWKSRDWKVPGTGSLERLPHHGRPLPAYAAPGRGTRPAGREAIDPDQIAIKSGLTSSATEVVVDGSKSEVRLLTSSPTGC